jgi:hypothetical protein
VGTLVGRAGLLEPASPDHGLAKALPRIPHPCYARLARTNSAHPAGILWFAYPHGRLFTPPMTRVRGSGSGSYQHSANQQDDLLGDAQKKGRALFAAWS